MSRLQGATAAGVSTDKLFKVRIAANRSVGLGDDKKICKTVIAGISAFAGMLGMLQIARAASKVTISLLWRKNPSNIINILCVDLIF